MLKNINFLGYLRIKMKTNLSQIFLYAFLFELIYSMNNQSSQSLLNETPKSSEEFECEYENYSNSNNNNNNKLNETVRLIRSKFNCRVFHICASTKQFTLTCVEGLYFDTTLNSCNFEHLVDCPTSSISFNLSTSADIISHQNFIDNITNNLFVENNNQNNSAFELFTTINSTQAINVESQAPFSSFRSLPLIELLVPSSITSTPISNFTATPISETSTVIVPTTSIPPFSTTTKSTTYSPVTFLLYSYNNTNSENVLENIDSDKLFSLNNTATNKSDETTIFETYHLNITQLNITDNLLVNQASRMSSNPSSTPPLPVSFTSHVNIESSDSSSTISMLASLYQLKNQSTNSIYTTIEQKLTQTSQKENSTYTNQNVSLTDRPWWLGPNECIPGFEHKIPHEKNCALYYQCQINGERIEKACQYPFLYDELYNECRPYKVVDCGKRTQAKDLCDYKLSFTSYNQIPCYLFPSCKNLSDGFYPLNDCRNYYECKDERTIKTYACPRNVSNGISLRFNFATQRCDFIENVSFDCGGYTIPINIHTKEMVCPDQIVLKSNEQTLSFELKGLLFSHPTDCTKYFVCSKNGNITSLECSNNTQFSPYHQNCVDQLIANCKKNVQAEEIMQKYLSKIYSANILSLSLNKLQRYKIDLNLAKTEEISSTTTPLPQTTTNVAIPLEPTNTQYLNESSILSLNNLTYLNNYSDESINNNNNNGSNGTLYFKDISLDVEFEPLNLNLITEPIFQLDLADSNYKNNSNFTVDQDMNINNNSITNLNQTMDLNYL